jgi:hypothetical protein
VHCTHAGRHFNRDLDDMAETCAPHTRPAQIGPSLLAADLANLAGESKRVIDAGADYLHIDIMVIARARSANARAEPQAHAPSPS